MQNSAQWYINNAETSAGYVLQEYDLRHGVQYWQPDHWILSAMQCNAVKTIQYTIVQYQNTQQLNTIPYNSKLSHHFWTWKRVTNS